MKTPRHVIAAALAQRSLGNVNTPKFAEEIAAYLLSEHRISELDSLLRDIMQYRADHGIVEVIAISAHSLTAQINNDIEAQMRELYPNAKKIIITPELDATAVGGIRLELANQQLDLTVRNKLNLFKQLTA
ncbi:MAG: synthase delta subunit [Candidatus Saccharibacteria bacterium]|nr:synthase delta subunit [Candidatus Saccharibacteria bacterium]